MHNQIKWSRVEWVPVTVNPNYVVNPFGEVRHQKFEDRRCAIYPSRSGEPMVSLYFKEYGNQRHYQVARLVGEAFVEDLYSQDGIKTVTVHLDGDKTNCRAENLVWRPVWFRRAYENQLEPYSRQTKIYCVTTDEYFDSYSQAAMAYGHLPADVLRSCVNNCEVFPLGFEFRFVD